MMKGHILHFHAAQTTGNSKGWVISMVTYSFVKIQAEISVMEKCHSNAPEFYGYIRDHNFCNTQGISMKFGGYLKEDMMHL